MTQAERRKEYACDVTYGTAKEFGFDWRLLAAQAFQESGFDPKAKSWVGARGLFQVMPRTGRDLARRSERRRRSNRSREFRRTRSLRASRRGDWSAW